MLHLLTIDVEQASRGIRGSRPSPEHGRLLSAAMDQFLEFLEECSCRATFFVLADEVPHLQGFLHNAIAIGHEIGCHGLHHDPADLSAPDSYLEQIREARLRIEDVTGHACVGFRAPWFSKPDNPTAFHQALIGAGFQYDASGRSALTDDTVASPIDTFDVPIVRGIFRPVGVLGGLALRLLPRRHIASLVKRCEQAGRPACLYLHPYEWSRSPVPRNATFAQRVRRHVAVSKTLPRLRWLLKGKNWTSIQSVRSQASRHAPPPRLAK